MNRRVWQALLWGGLVAALAVANTGIATREKTLAEGRVVLLALAPVDPRSLMQGDYMALRFAAADTIRDALARPRGRCVPSVPGSVPASSDCTAPDVGLDRRERGRRDDGYAVFALDAGGVGRFVRVQAAATPVAERQVAVRFRHRGQDLRIASDAWFFPEGQGRRYEAAAFGELRVDAGGTALLAGLRDAARKPL